jgi:hypothetical protein
VGLLQFFNCPNKLKHFKHKIKKNNVLNLLGKFKPFENWSGFRMNKNKILTAKFEKLPSRLGVFSFFF